MTSKGEGQPLVPAPVDAALVTRSTVPLGLKYGEYRQTLRHDFIYSCAYCTMSEAEAQAIRFTIDHYEPKNERPDLINDYENLMYSCDECNSRKGDRCPPAEARVDGHRFFRPDQDRYQDHFHKNGVRLEAQSNTGNYSLDALDLNRLSLRRLRDIRERLHRCDRLVVEGVLGLRTFHIDRLPPDVKGKAARAIRQAVSMADKVADDIDSVLRDFARSPLIDPDPDSEARAEERAAKLQQRQALYPGNWRAPRKNQASGRR
jgi:HNH endonuclease